MVTVDGAARYLLAYTSQYRFEYGRLTGERPTGAGFPRIVSSPYLSNDELKCFLASDGAIVTSSSHEPEYEWAIAGGPALMVDHRDPDSRVPPNITKRLRESGALGQSIGISRVNFPEPPAAEVWEGHIPLATESVTRYGDDGQPIHVAKVPLRWAELIERLTFGAFGPILDPHLPDTDEADFWQPVVIRDLGFTTADRQHQRWFHHLELLRHADPAAWDSRSAWARAKVDVRRDMAHSIAMLGRAGGTTTLGPAPYHEILERFNDRLRVLESALEGFTALLEAQPGSDEAVFQKYLEEHPLLLDVYGEIVPRPRFEYPAGSTPTGKKFVEPDFIIRSPTDRYAIIEIERPGKQIATKAGQARAEVTQATFQIAEFKDFVLEHYDVLKARFPGINRSPQTIVIISRTTESSFGGRTDTQRHLKLLREQIGADELLTYDDLILRARGVIERLSGLR